MDYGICGNSYFLVRWSNAPGELGGRVMPDPGDRKCGKMLHYCPKEGGGGGGGIAGIV